MEVHDFLLRFVDDQLEDVWIGDEDAILVGADLEERHSEAIFLFGVQTLLLGKGKALSSPKPDSSSIGQFQKLEQGRTIKLISLDELHKIWLKVLLPFHAVLHHILILMRKGRQGYLRIVREDLDQLFGQPHKILLTLGDDLDRVLEVHCNLELAGSFSLFLRDFELLVELDVEVAAGHELAADYAVFDGSDRRVERDV